jgi:hypothetical protein
MKKSLNRTIPFFIIILCGVLLMIEKGSAFDKALLEKSSPYPNRESYGGPISDDVRIVYSGAYMPLGHFLLIRKKNEICALKFTKFWNEKQGAEIERNAVYISYYQNDGSGNLLSPNVKITEGQASSLPWRVFTRLFMWQPGTTYIKCGPLKLAWQYYGGVCACKDNGPPRDYGFEFASAPWENITEVNLSDKQIKWYRYDKNREKIDIPIDKLWKEPEQ